MYKKLLAFALALCLCISLAACAKTPASSTAPTPSDTTESKSDTTDSKYPLVSSPVTVEGVVFGSSDDTKRITWDKLAELTGITVNWKIVSDEQKPVFIAAGNWPDLFHGGFGDDLIEEWGVVGKKLVNFEDYADVMPNLQQTYKDYDNYGGKRIAQATDGGVYGLIRIDDGPTNTVVRMHYNADVLKEYGLETPTTTEEFYNVLKAIQAKTGEAPMADTMLAYSWANPCDVFIFPSFGKLTQPDFAADENGKVSNGRLSDQYRLTMQYMNRLYAEGLLLKEYLTLDSSTRKSLIEARKAVFGMDQFANISVDVVGGSWDNLKTLAPLTSEYDNERVVEASNPIEKTRTVVNADSKYAKEICQMLDIFFASKEVAEGTGLYGVAGTYGPENVTWKWVDKDHTTYEYIIPSDYTEAANTFQNNRVIFSNLGRYDVFKNAVVAEESNNRARQLGFIENFHPYKEKHPFVYGSLNEEEQNVVNTYLTDFQEYVKEWNSAFITGTKNPNDDAVWKEYIDGFAKLHTDELIGAYQSAYERFKGK